MKLDIRKFDSSNLLSYLCNAKRRRDGLCHRRIKDQTGHRAQPDLAKRKSAPDCPPAVLKLLQGRAYDTVEMTHPHYPTLVNRITVN